MIPRHPRYQDYVIRDGKFVGEFEQMYQAYDNPWDQLGDVNALDRVLGVALLRRHGHCRPLEYGCGLGQYTRMLHDTLGAAAGVDISPTAIARARAMAVGPQFFVGDILATEPLETFRPDAVVLAQVTWYVLEQLAALKQLLRGRPGLGFLHLLEVYPKGVQAYGREYFVDLPSILDYWSDLIEPLEWGHVERPEDAGGGRTFLYGRVRA